MKQELDSQPRAERDPDRAGGDLVERLLNMKSGPYWIAKEKEKTRYWQSLAEHWHGKFETWKARAKAAEDREAQLREALEDLPSLLMAMSQRLSLNESDSSFRDQINMANGAIHQALQDKSNG